MADALSFGGRLEIRRDDGPDVNVRLDCSVLPGGTGLVRARHLVYSTFPATGLGALAVTGETVRQLHHLLFAATPMMDDRLIPCPCCAGEGWLACPLCGGEGATTRKKAARWRRGFWP